MLLRQGTACYLYSLGTQLLQCYLDSTSTTSTTKNFPACKHFFLPHMLPRHKPRKMLPMDRKPRWCFYFCMFLAMCVSFPRNCHSKVSNMFQQRRSFLVCFFKTFVSQQRSKKSLHENLCHWPSSLESPTESKKDLHGRIWSPFGEV